MFLKTDPYQGMHIKVTTNERKNRLEITNFRNLTQLETRGY